MIRLSEYCGFKVGDRVKGSFGSGEIGTVRRDADGALCVWY